MCSVLTAKDVFERTRDAALAATDQDEKPLQIDYSALEGKIERALAGRKIALLHINKFLPEGYEDQGRFNLIVMTNGNVLFDMVIGDSYFRYDVFSCCDLDKIQLIDGTWDNKENRTQDSFLSLRLMHGDEAHILLALSDDQREPVMAIADKISQGRHPERAS
ncbi:MAG: hypothetical protein E4H32_03345 [Nitrospirales bacterium]|nr:MAG: hypothetical protein E4H32_03345 [Nitrospirales bacterium]